MSIRGAKLDKKTGNVTVFMDLHICVCVLARTHVCVHMLAMGILHENVSSPRSAGSRFLPMAQPEFAGECVVLLQGLTDGKPVPSHQPKVT